MARARNIKPGFFKNEDLAECSLAARLCFAGLWTLADREGRLEDRPKRIKGELFPFDSFDVEPLLQELARFRFIVRYEVDGQRCIQVSNFLKHQTPHYTEKESLIKPPSLQESEPHKGDGDSKKPPGVDPSLRGGQNPLNPDSLNPDSLNPDSLNPLATPIGVAGASKPRPAKKAPAGCALTPELRAWAAENAPLVDADAELAKFMDHTFASAKTDWAGTFRNWLRRAQEDAQRSHRPRVVGADEPQWRREQRERTEAFLGPYAKRKDPNVIDMEAANAVAKVVG